MKTLLIALLLSTSATAIAGESDSSEPAAVADIPIELKGASLGISYDQAMTLFPESECHHSQSLKGFSFCKNKKAQFADGRARMTATFIDETLVRLEYDSISTAKYKLVLEAFTTKYGKSTIDHRQGANSVIGVGAQGTNFWRNSKCSGLINMDSPKGSILLLNTKVSSYDQKDIFIRI